MAQRECYFPNGPFAAYDAPGDARQTVTENLLDSSGRRVKINSISLHAPRSLAPRAGFPSSIEKRKGKK